MKGLVQTQLRDSSSQGSQPVQLREGEGRRYQCLPDQTGQRKVGQVTAIPIDPVKFERMHVEQPGDRYQRWLAYSRQLRKDPSLVAYYSFEAVGDGDSSILPNVAATGRPLDAQIIGPLWTAGRFPGKVALHFRGPGSEDKVELPEQDRFNFSGPFSVAVWFKPYWMDERASADHQGPRVMANRPPRA